MKPIKPYFADCGRPWGVLVFAYTAREAKKLGCRALAGLSDDVKYNNVLVLRLKSNEHAFACADQGKLAAGKPHVVDSWKRCYQCGSADLDLDAGFCRPCLYGRCAQCGATLGEYMDCPQCGTDPLRGEMKAMSMHDPNNWYIDGSPAWHAVELFDGLKWETAHMDNGPSPAGNPGPYWHVECGWIHHCGCVHRLYPRRPRNQAQLLSLLREVVALVVNEAAK